MMHKLCKTIQVDTISAIDRKGTSALFCIILHLSFKIPNARSTHIRVEDCKDTNTRPSSPQGSSSSPP
jgi:hypothetical protein